MPTSGDQPESPAAQYTCPFDGGREFYVYALAPETATATVVCVSCGSMGYLTKGK